MSAPSRTLALAVLCAASLMVVLDGSIVTVALPAVQADLGFSPAGLSWTVTAYVIAFGGLMLFAGRLGDLLGRRAVFLAGLAVFTAASLLCGLAVNPGMLVAARFLQGAGGALASAVSLGMISVLFPAPAERARAFGAFAFTGAAGASIGQVLGGFLTDGLGWEAVFLINLPIGAAAIVLALRALPADKGTGLRAGADALGAVLITGGLMLGVYAIGQAGHAGWTAPGTLGAGGLAALLVAAFAVRQTRAAAPLLPPRLVRVRNVWAANLVQMLMLGALFSFQVLIALYLQNVLGYSALRTGLAMLPAAVAIGAGSLLLSARLITRFGERAMLVTGLVLLLAARVFLARLPVDATYVVDVLPLMLLSAGFGLAMPALTGLAMSAARPEDAGVASGLFNTTQQVGAALGVAAFTSLAAAHGGPGAEALNTGYRWGFNGGAVLLGLALLLALALLRSPRAAASAAGRTGRAAVSR